MEHLRAAGEHLQQPDARPASTAPARRSTAARVAGQVTGGDRRTGQRAGAQRVADALPAPRFQQAGRVPGDQHPAVAQRRVLRPAAGQVTGVVLRRHPGQAQPVDEVAQVVPGPLPRAPGRRSRRRSAGHPWGRPRRTSRASAPSPAAAAPASGSCSRRRHRQLQLQPQVHLPVPHADVPGGHPRGAVRADHRAGARRRRRRPAAGVPRRGPARSRGPATRSRTCAPAATAAARSRSSNSSRRTIVTSGPPVRRVNSRRPSRVNVTRSTRSCAGTSIRSGDRRQRGADQATAAGLVAGVRGPLDDQGTHARRGQRRGPRRARRGRRRRRRDPRRSRVQPRAPLGGAAPDRRRARGGRPHRCAAHPRAPTAGTPAYRAARRPGRRPMRGGSHAAGAAVGGRGTGVPGGDHAGGTRAGALPGPDRRGVRADRRSSRTRPLHLLTEKDLLHREDSPMAGLDFGPRCCARQMA